MVLERISSSTPGVHDSAAAALSSQITENLVTKSSVLPLSQLVLEEKKKKKKSGFSQPQECFSCQIGKPNELMMMESKMPHLFKTSLNPGCLIVASYSTALSHTSFTLPVREPDRRATQARCREGQLVVKLDPELDSEKSVSSGYGPTDGGL